MPLFFSATPALPIPTLPTSLPAAAAVPESIKAALPALTVMLVNGALNLIAASIILVAGWTVARWLARWTHNFLTRATHVDETLKPLLVNFVRYVVLGITLVAVVSQFGVQTTSLITLLGATGIAVGLALQGTLSNVASGVMLLFLRPFRVLEKIVITGVTGTVQEIGLFRTVLVTDDGLYVSIPNSNIFSGVIINASRQPTRRTDFSVDIDRDADIEAAKKTMLEAIATDEHVLRNPAPRVVVDDLDGTKVLLTLQAWVGNRDFTVVQSDLRIKVRRALSDAGFSPPIPVPAPAVAPWSPPPEKAEEKKSARPN